jgi:osmoprotectant transport system ATP-binding protein
VVYLREEEEESSTAFQSYPSDANRKRRARLGGRLPLPRIADARVDEARADGARSRTIGMTGAPQSSARCAEIAFRNACKQYEGRQQLAVNHLDFEIPPGEICVLIGPSGCGKTTALKLVNRLITISSGDITIDGRSIHDLQVTELRRQIGYVFQQIGLFPHMTIEDNIGTVPRLLGWSKQQIRVRAGELLELVGLDPAADLRHYPGEFSGGQQQRIGVARAMAVDPPTMLMDEPFGAIDPITRDRLQDDFLRLHREAPKTIIFVTHDIDEAIKMGDRIAIMRDGHLRQWGTADEILARPADDFVADFVGADRGLKRLRVRTLRDVELEPLSPGDRGGSPSVSITSSLHDALSVMLSEGREALTVYDEDQSHPVGTVRLEAITATLSPAAKVLSA